MFIIHNVVLVYHILWCYPLKFVGVKWQNVKGAFCKATCEGATAQTDAWLHIASTGELLVMKRMEFVVLWLFMLLICKCHYNGDWLYSQMNTHCVDTWFVIWISTVNIKHACSPHDCQWFMQCFCAYKSISDI